MSAATRGTQNKPGPAPGEAQAKATTQNAEANAQTISNHESDQTAKEAQVDQNVENFFQDEPEYTVVADDFRAALDAQLAYYKQTITSLRDLIAKTCKERDDAQNHARSVKAGLDKVVSSSASNDYRLRQAVSAIQAAVKEDSRKLEQLSNLLPESVKRGMAVNPRHTSSSSQTGDVFGINRLADDINQFIQTVIKLVQLSSRTQIRSSNPRVQVAAQTDLQPDIGGGIEGGTCRQRLREREFEIERLENRIRLTGGIVTDLLTQSEFILDNIETDLEEVVEIDDIAETLQPQEEIQAPPEKEEIQAPPEKEEIQALPEEDEQLNSYKDLLRRQLLVDPDDTTGAAQSLKDAIAKRESENAKKVVTAPGGKTEPFKKPSDSMKSGILVAASDTTPQVVKAQEASGAVAPTGTDDAAAMRKEHSAIVDSKNQIIRQLTKGVHEAYALSATYRENFKRLKKDSAAKEGDLQKRLSDCLAKHTATLPPASKPKSGDYRGDNGGDKGGDNGGDNGGNFGNDDGGGNFGNDDDGGNFGNDDGGGNFGNDDDGGNFGNIDDDDDYDPLQLPVPANSPPKGRLSTMPHSHKSPSQVPQSQRSPSKGPKSTRPQPHGAPSQVQPSQRSPSNECQSQGLQPKKKLSKQSSPKQLSRSPPHPKIPRPPPQPSTPPPPKKKRRVGERESTLMRLRRESQEFRESKGSTRLNRPGF